MQRPALPGRGSAHRALVFALATRRVAGRAGVERGRLLNIVVAEEDLGVDRIDENRVRRGATVVPHVEHDRLVGWPNAVGGRRKGHEPHSLEVIQPRRSEGEPAVDVLAGAEREHRKVLADVGRGHQPGLLGAEHGLRGSSPVSRRRRRDVRDLAADHANRNQAVLRSRQSTEGLAEEHGMAVVARHFRVVQYLEIRDSLVRQTEERLVGADEAAGRRDGIAAESGREVAAVVDQRRRRAVLVPGHVGAEAGHDCLLRGRRRHARHTRIEIWKTLLRLKDVPDALRSPGQGQDRSGKGDHSEEEKPGQPHESASSEPGFLDASARRDGDLRSPLGVPPTKCAPAKSGGTYTQLGRKCNLGYLGRFRKGKFAYLKRP